MAVDRLRAFALATPLITAFEGYSAEPYLCPAGVWTIGYGTAFYPDGRSVTPNDDAIDESTAAACLLSGLRKIADRLAPLLRREPTAAQFAALLSLAYNVGVGVQDGVKGDLADSTLVARFNAGDIAGAADEFLKWNKARVGGRLRVLRGLTARRAAERALFLGETADVSGEAQSAQPE